MKAMPEDPFHLTVEIVREIHDTAIAEFGGSTGVRELSLLESAVAAPQASIGGRSPYADLAEMAAAYLFYLCKNHPFVDGNKRSGLLAAMLFLEANGIRFSATEEDAVVQTLALAAGAITAEDFAAWLKRVSRPGGPE